MAKKSRANNGMGSIRQRPDKRWEARYTTPDGRQRSIYALSEKEVTAKLRAALSAIDNGAWQEPSKLTMAQWLEIWLEDYQSHTTGRTVETYRIAVRNHMIPIFGRVKVSSMSQMHVRRMITTMTKDGFSPASIKQSRGILSAAMKCAIEAGLIKSNPVQGVRGPRLVKPKYTIIDRDMFPAFIQAAEKTRIANALVFLLMTGLRAGEMRGLRWSDIDGSVMHVNRQLHAPSRKKRTFGIPKDGEVRDVQLPQEAVELLKRQRKQQLEQRMSAGGEWVEDEYTTDLVFRTEQGWNLDESYIYSAVKTIRTEMGLPDLRPHDLRHSYAVAALRSGIDVKTVQHNLGHKHASITLDTYAAYTDDAGKTGAKRFDSYWKEALKMPE